MLPGGSLPSIFLKFVLQRIAEVLRQLRPNHTPGTNLGVENRQSWLKASLIPGPGSLVDFASAPADDQPEAAEAQ